VNEHFCSLEEAHNLLDNAANVVSPSSKFDDSVPDMDLASTDDSSLGDTSLSSTEVDSPGSAAWDTPMKPHAITSSVPPSTPPSSTSTTRPSLRREVISFGDSIEERTAVKIVSDQLDALPKSVKFLNNPTPVQIIGQLTMLTHHMNFVCEHAEDLDLEISKGQAEKCASGYLARKGLKSRRSTEAAAAPSILQRMFGSTMAAGGGDDVEMHDC